MGRRSGEVGWNDDLGPKLEGREDLPSHCVDLRYTPTLYQNPLEPKNLREGIW